jgi:hypothetical protein
MADPEAARAVDALGTFALVRGLPVLPDDLECAEVLLRPLLAGLGNIRTADLRDIEPATSGSCRI